MDNQNIKACGSYSFEIVRDGKVIDQWSMKNVVPTEGLNYLLETGCRAGTPASAFYLGIFQGNYTPVSTDTAAAFPTSATECTSYSEVARQACTFAVASAGATTNTASPAQFTFTAAQTVYGSFVSSASAKSATSGTLLSAARFPAAKVMGIGDILRVSYTISLTSA